MIRARIRVDGRLEGDLQALWGVPMEASQWLWRARWRIGHGERRSRTELARVGGHVGLAGGQWQKGAVRLGVEWLAISQGAAELLLPRPALGKMQE